MFGRPEPSVCACFPPASLPSTHWARSSLLGDGGAFPAPRKAQCGQGRQCAEQGERGHLSLMPCQLLNSVRTKELILAVTGPWGWVSGVTLELVPKRTRNNQTEKGEKASGQKGWRCERRV